MGVWKVRSCFFLYPSIEGYSFHSGYKANINTAQDGERKTGEDMVGLVLKPDVHAKRFTKEFALPGTIHRF